MISAFSDKAPNKEASISIFFIFSELKKVVTTYTINTDSYISMSLMLQSCKNQNLPLMEKENDGSGL